MKSFLLVIAACLLSLPASVHAQATPAHALSALPQGAEPRVGRYVQLIVDDQGDGLAAGHFDFPFNPAVTTVVLFPEDIERGRGLPKPEFELDIRGRTAALFTTRRRLKRDLQRNVTLFSENISVGMMLTAVDDPDDAIALAVVRTRSQVEQWRAARADYVAGLERENEREVERRADAKAIERFLAHGTLVQPMLVHGDVAPHAPGMQAVTISDFEGMWWGADDMLVSFTVRNTGETAFDWSEARVFGPDRDEYPASAAHIQMPAIVGEGLVGRLPAGKHARAAMLVEGAKALTGPMTIMLDDHGGGRPIVATVGDWMSLQTEKAYTGWEIRPARPPEPPDPEKDKVSLHLQGVYGAIWLSDGAGLDETAATSLAGLGVRAQYAFNRYIAVEGEVMGASTGEARFPGVMYDGMQGDLARSAALGRMQFGGVLRLGEQYVPVLRLGVGLQGTSHSGTLVTATGDVPGPESFELKGLLSLGTGLDIRLGSSFIAGAALSATFLGGFDQVQSLEAGVHLGYAWKP